MKAARYSSQKLDELMVEQGRMNIWLADRLGVHESYISRLRSGERAITEKLANKIALILGVPVSYFEQDRAA